MVRCLGLPLATHVMLFGVMLGAHNAWGMAQNLELDGATQTSTSQTTTTTTSTTTHTGSTTMTTMYTSTFTGSTTTSAKFAYNGQCAGVTPCLGNPHCASCLTAINSTSDVHTHGLDTLAHRP